MFRKEWRTYSTDCKSQLGFSFMYILFWAIYQSYDR
jgi:hypothetical protein